MTLTDNIKDKSYIVAQRKIGNYVAELYRRIAGMFALHRTWVVRTTIDTPEKGSSKSKKRVCFDFFPEIFIFRVQVFIVAVRKILLCVKLLDGEKRLLTKNTYC